MPRTRSTVPLMWRVPNVPPTFVGRRAELGAIKAALRRGPVVVLAGAGGLGKTALASAVVRDVLEPDRAKRAVMVSAHAAAPFKQTLTDVVRALGHADARGDADFLMLAIDLAEARRAVVVLDDLHHVLPEAGAALVTIARYARRAIWIATSRVAPAAPELAGQVIELVPLGEKHLVAVARLVNPKLSRADRARISREAHGSPWKAKQLAGGYVEARVDETSQALLSTLSVLERPISKTALAGTVNGEVGGALDDLVRRGLIEVVANGYRLHEAARPLVTSDHTPDSTRTITALAAGGDSDAVEALRLALKANDTKRALAVCEASFDAMLRAGHAATLWKLVSSREGAPWNTFKLRAAMQLADVKITTLLDEPPKDALRDRLLWVRALFVEAKTKEAALAADALAEVAEQGKDERIAFWATLERAMAARIHTGPDRGLELLERVHPIDEATRALRASLRAFWLAEVGRIDESIRTLERGSAGRTPPTEFADEILGGPLDFFVRYYRMAALMECGHLERAHAELTAGRENLGIDDQLRASYVQLDGIANLAIARGRLDEAATILERLLRPTPTLGGSTYHTIARLLDVERRIAGGAFNDVAAVLDQLLSDTHTRNRLVHAWCLDTRERLHIVQAVEAEPPLDLEASPVGSVARSVLALRRALRRARWGRPHDVPEAIDVEGAIVRELVLGTDALVAGHSAVEHARKALDIATSHGWGVRECEARELLAEALLVGGDKRRAVAEAHALGKRAGAMSSPRFEGEAQSLAALGELDVAALEEQALADGVSPCAARRARAVLGDASVKLDAVDERVVAQARAAAEIIRVGASGAHVRGWGLDVHRSAVWLPSGRRISFARHMLLARVLEVLAGHGGVASFELLAREVWQRRTFHPLNDGNRIRVTLHRLRALVEEDPQKPERIVLAGSSYTLGGEPFTLVRPKA